MARPELVGSGDKVTLFGGSLYAGSEAICCIVYVASNGSSLGLKLLDLLGESKMSLFGE